MSHNLCKSTMSSGTLTANSRLFASRSKRGPSKTAANWCCCFFLLRKWHRPSRNCNLQHRTTDWSRIIKLWSVCQEHGWSWQCGHLQPGRYSGNRSAQTMTWKVGITDWMPRPIMDVWTSISWFSCFIPRLCWQLSMWSCSLHWQSYSKLHRHISKYWDDYTSGSHSASCLLSACVCVSMPRLHADWTVNQIC